jgi:hypothetical protein
MATDEQFRRFLNEDSPKIEGWFSRPDMLTFQLLDAVQRALGRRGHLCEVGVWHGKSLVLLSHFAEANERCFGFDLFPDDIRDRAWANIQAYGRQDAVELVTGDTSGLSSPDLEARLGGGIRFLHIDAGHEYHEVLHQLLLFAPFVAPGGCIAMDDYQDREFPGIEAATLDFAEIDRPRRFVPFFAGGNKMYLCEPAWAPEYQRRMLSIEPIASTSRVSRVRDFTVLVGFSKLPTGRAACLAEIERAAFPLRYEVDEQSLSGRAERFSQLRFAPFRT